MENKCLTMNYVKINIANLIYLSNMAIPQINPTFNGHLSGFWSPKKIKPTIEHFYSIFFFFYQITLYSFFLDILFYSF